MMNKLAVTSDIMVMLASEMAQIEARDLYNLENQHIKAYLFLKIKKKNKTMQNLTSCFIKV